MNIQTANKLLSLRKENGLSQEDLAEKLGISRQAVSKWERGEASPDTDNLIQLANLYRISLDELLDIDVKTFKKEDFPSSTNDPYAKTIKLTKSNDDDLNYIFSEPTSKRVVYPKDSLDREIYPKSKSNSTPYQETFPSNIYDDINNVSTVYQQQNPIIPMQNQYNKSSNSSQYQSFQYSKGKKKKKKKIYTPPPFTNNKFINKFESFMAKHKLTYKGLYTFPVYAIGIALAVLCMEVLPYYDAEYLAGASVLSIPLYYTFIKAIKRRNANYFGYPILAIILILISMFIGFDELSLGWLATIPFYYWFINKNK